MPSLEFLFCLYLAATEYHMEEESKKRETGDVNFKSSCLIRGELPCDPVREI
jgi:hypothetical protein